MQHSSFSIGYFTFFSYKKLVVYHKHEAYLFEPSIFLYNYLYFLLATFLVNSLSTVPSSFTPKYVLIDLVMLLIVESTEFIRLSTVFPVLDLIATLFSVLPFLLSTFLSD